MKIYLYLILSIFSLNIKAVECERVKISSECYGECGSFLDENNNSICDVWERYNKKSDILRADNQNNIKKTEFTINISTNSKTSTPQKAKNRSEKIFRYGILWIFILNLIMIIITEIFFKSFNCFIRLFWNWVLFISCVLCAFSGFFMYFDIFTDFKKDFFSIHLQTAVISTVTGFYHTYKRFSCMIRK